MSNIPHNQIRCSTSKGYAIMEAIQDDRRKYMKYPDIASEFKAIPPLDKSYIIDNKKSLSQSSLHHIAPECVPIFHEAYKKTKENISQILGRLASNPLIADYTTPKTNIAIGNSQIIKESNPYSVSHFGNFPLERLYTDAENLTHLPPKSGFFGAITKKISLDFTLPWNRIMGQDIFKHSEEYLIKQQDEKLQKPKTDNIQQKDLYREAFGLSQPFITNAPSSHVIQNDTIPSPSSIPSDIPLSHPISDTVNGAIRAIQNGATIILKNTTYIGQDILKEMQSLNNLAMSHPFATTMIGVGTLGLLYKTFKKQNEENTKDEAK